MCYKVKKVWVVKKKKIKSTKSQDNKIELIVKRVNKISCYNV
jgi:hypothetical protein